MNWLIRSILTTLLVWIGISTLSGVFLSYFYEHKFFIAWYDFWIGIYYDRHKRIIYINPFPCIVFSFDRNEKRNNPIDENIKEIENEENKNIDKKY